LAGACPARVSMVFPVVGMSSTQRTSRNPRTSRRRSLVIYRWPYSVPASIARDPIMRGVMGEGDGVRDEIRQDQDRVVDKQREQPPFRGLRKSALILAESSRTAAGDLAIGNDRPVVSTSSRQAAGTRGPASPVSSSAHGRVGGHRTLKQACGWCRVPGFSGGRQVPAGRPAGFGTCAELAEAPGFSHGQSHFGREAGGGKRFQLEL